MGGKHAYRRSATTNPAADTLAGTRRLLDAYDRSCDACQRSRADHAGPSGLLHPLPPSSRRGDVIWVYWLLSLPMTVSGFDKVQVHVEHHCGKVHTVPTRHGHGGGVGHLEMALLDHDPKFTNALLKEFVRCICSSLLIGSAYHNNTNAKAERVNGVLGDTQRAFANGSKDDWIPGTLSRGTWQPYADFAINNAALTLDGERTPFFIDRDQYPRMPLTIPDGPPENNRLPIMEQLLNRETLRGRTGPDLLLGLPPR